MYGGKSANIRNSTILTYWGPNYDSLLRTQNNNPGYDQSFFRSGTNSTSRKGYFQRPAPTFKTVIYRVMKGPRLAYKVYSKRLKKMVWARKPILVYKVKKIRSKFKYAKGLDLFPNALNYNGYTLEKASFDTEATARYPKDNPQYGVKFVGALWDNFLYSHSGSSGSSVYDFTGMFYNFSGAVTEASESALKRLYSKIKQQDVNLAVALAERAQTASMIKDLAVRLGKGINAMRKGNIRAAARILLPGNSRDVANDFLVYQYGISPLISDLQGIAKELTEKGRELVYDVRVKAQVPVFEDVVRNDTEASGLRLKMKTKVTSAGHVDVVYKCRVRVNAVHFRILNTLGLTNFGAVLWEKIPWSFVVDWLLPISNWLNTHDAFEGLTVEYVTKTVTRVEYVVFDRSWGGTGVYDQWYADPGSCRCYLKNVSCVRTILPSVPELPMPSFKDPTSAGHIANAIALLRQLRR